MIDRRRRPFDTRLFMTMRDETCSARSHCSTYRERSQEQPTIQRQLVRTFLAKWIWRGATTRRGWLHAPGRIPWQTRASHSSNTAKSNSTNGGIMTKHLLNKLPFLFAALALLLGLAPAAYAGVPSMNVTVFDANSKVAFKGPINANATFATGNLPPGNYVVQFNAKSAAVKNNQYLLVVSAGKKKVIAADVPGEKFMAGGVAMKVDVGPGLKINGQVAIEQSVAQGVGPRYRVIDGKRYFWVGAELGSNRGGHWVEESLAPAGNLTAWSKDGIRTFQDTAGEGSMISYKTRYDPPPHGY